MTRTEPTESPVARRSLPPRSIPRSVHCRKSYSEGKGKVGSRPPRRAAVRRRRHRRRCGRRRRLCNPKIREQRRRRQRRQLNVCSDLQKRLQAVGWRTTASGLGREERRFGANLPEASTMDGRGRAEGRKDGGRGGGSGEAGGQRCSFRETATRSATVTGSELQPQQIREALPPHAHACRMIPLDNLVIM